MKEVGDERVIEDEVGKIRLDHEEFMYCAKEFELDSKNKRANRSLWARQAG